MCVGAIVAARSVVIVGVVPRAVVRVGGAVRASLGAVAAALAAVNAMFSVACNENI